MNTDQVDQTSTPVERCQCQQSSNNVDGEALTRSENVDVGAVVREVGHGVEDIRSGDGDSSRSASGREEFGILSKVSGLNRCQGSIHRLLAESTTDRRMSLEHRKQPAVQGVSERLCE